MRLTIAISVDSVTFTPGVIAGTESLGGSESACLGLARALAQRGHAVHVFVTKIGPGVAPVDHAGVHWHDMSKMAAWAFYADWDVAIALRQPEYLQAMPAKLRVLWCQDLMANEAMKQHVMSLAWAYDAVAYVSAFHRKQWEGVAPELARIGWVTRNGHDAALAASARASATKKPHQIIHISRPERGLWPLMAMWPMLRKERPDATLAICRYSSMYDPKGWGEVCKNFDQLVAEVNAEVGGITYLGELGKPALYQAIAESAVMWYPGVATFGETSCIAAVEAQACGTPFVGSLKGALPETVPYGVLVPGDAEADADYHAASVRAVVAALDGCRTSSFDYRRQVKAGLAHVSSYSYEAVAADWEQWLFETFRQRYATEKRAILHRLDHDDDLVTACVVADELAAETTDATAREECQAIKALTARIGAGLSHSADDYASHALDTSAEVAGKGARHEAIAQALDGCQRVVDFACGNGAIAILLAQADARRTVVAADFSDANIAAARAAAESFGVADRITFVHAPVWDMAQQQPSPWLDGLAPHTFDGAVCGEFLEHLLDPSGMIAAIERCVTHMGRIVVTVPSGPLTSLMPRHDTVHRAHVQHFRPADLDTMFGQKDGYTRLALPWATTTGRGEPVGQWIVSYRNDGPTVAPKDLARRILTRPYYRLSAGLIVNDATDLRRCLENVWPTVDEIVLGDCGCRPGTLEAVAAEFPRKTKIVPVGEVSSLKRGFSEARNRVLDATSGDWFLWIDADEVLCGELDLGKYLDGPVFSAMVIPQNHLHLDRAMHTDIPARVFRKGRDIRFYGCIHEQPQMGHVNGDITPLLRLTDVQIAHTGYLHEALRRHKVVTRNLPLLIRDRQEFPDRELGALLVLREHVNLGTWELERTRGAMTPTIQHHFAQAVGIYEQSFADTTNKYHGLAQPFYEQALRMVSGSIEIEIGVACGVGGLGDAHAKPIRLWARTPAQVRAILHQRIDEMLAKIDATPAIDVEPIATEVVA